MSGTKEHFTCKICSSIQVEVPRNGGFCANCGAKHGWTFLMEGDDMVTDIPTMLGSEPKFQRIEFTITLSEMSAYPGVVITIGAAVSIWS
jgi:hypothetical protein